MSKLTSWFEWLSSLPSIVWIGIFIGGIIGLIGTIITLFWALGNIEGFASVIFLIIAVAAVFGSPDYSYPEGKTETPSIIKAGLIAFFALMGMAVDQPGNYFYNLPIEWLGCPGGTSLTRSVVVSHPLPERTDITQSFQCFGANGEVVHQVDLLYVIAIRFVEYVVLAYVLIGLKKGWRLFKRPSGHS